MVEKPDEENEEDELLPKEGEEDDKGGELLKEDIDDDGEESLLPALHAPQSWGHQLHVSYPSHAPLPQFAGLVQMFCPL